MVADTYIRDRAELRRQAIAAMAARKKATDPIQLELLTARVDVLLDRWNAVEER